MWALGLCVAVLAATTCSGWDLNSEYHYKVDTKILHELDKKTHQHSGFMGSSTFIVQVKENAILLKTVNTRWHPVNERPDPDHDHEHHYQTVPLELEQQFAKPFRINYDHGVLTSIDVAKDDPQWSVNLKKGIAARFQLQNINSKNASERNFYTRSEDGPSGECEVDYEIDLEGKNNEIYVTKTKDFDKCKSIPYRYYDNQNLWNCFEGENSFYQPFQKSETTYTDMTGTREDYYIHWQRAEETFTYAPYGLEADYIKGNADTKMTLTEIVPLTEEIKIPDDAVTHHDLHSEFHKAPAIKSAEDLKTHPYGFYYFLGQKYPVEKVAEMFERVMTVDDGKKYTEVFNQKPMPLLFLQMSYAMATLNYDELKDLHENHVKKEGQPGEKMHIRKFIFGDALVAAGTSSAFMYLKDLMTSGKIEHSIVNHLLKQIPMALQPISEILLEEFYELCKDPHIHDNVSNRKVCYLAFSTVVHEMCVSRYHKVQEKYTPAERIRCTPEIADKFFQKILAEPEVHAEDSFSRILFIKVAGNFGTRGSLEALLKIIGDDEIHQYFRFNAIMALEHHANNYPEEVLHALLPIYYSSLAEPQEIRMAAFLYILFSQPKVAHLEAIVQNLENEPDHQVAHYVKTSVEQIAEMEAPCYSELILVCKKAATFLKRLDFKTNYDFRHSFGWYNDGFNRKFQIGGMTNVNYFTSNQSYIPQHVYVYLMDYVGRTMRSPLDIGYNGYGINKVIDNFFGIPRVKDAQAPTVEKELKEFDEKLHIEVREHEPMLADFYLNSFGSTLDFFHLNDTTFENMAKKDVGQLPALLESVKNIGEASLKRFYVGRQQKFVMPSSLGCPFVISTGEVNFAHYRNNQFKLNVDPNLFTGAKNDGAPPTINVKIDAHIVHDRVLIANMGTPLPVFRISASAGVLEREYSSLPLKLKIALDPKTPKLVVKYTPILPHTRIHNSFTPLTIVHNMSNTNASVSDPDFKPYLKPQEYVKIDKDFFHDYLGYGINVKGVVGPNRKLDSWGSLKKFIMENDLRTKLYYLEHNPLAVAYDYQVSLTPASKDQPTEIDLEFTVDHWGFDTHSDKSHKPPFPVVKDGHEDYINSRDDRKARTCVAKIDLTSKGTKERTLHIGLGYTHTFDDRYHQVNFNYDRSPFGPEETDHFKICSSSSIMFPHVDMQKLHALDTVDMDPKIEVATDIHFGKNCESDKKITLRGQMVRTEEHQQHEADRENPDADHLEAKLYQKCKKNIENDHLYSSKCRYYWYRTLKLRDYKMDIELENLNAHDKEHLEHLDSCLKHYLHYYLTEHHHEVEHNPNKIHIDANFSATTDHVDIRIEKPDETLEFDHVPHPETIQARSASPFFEFTNKMVKWHYYSFPYCAVEGNHVHTFDDVHYDIPPMDCFKVIAKDCSRGKLFTILAKKVANNRFHKAIKVFLGNWLIEALPVSADSDLLVRINGEHIPVTEEKPHFHYQTRNDKDHLMFTVSYDGLFYKIKSQKYGVTVYYDGNAVVVNLSPYYRGKQCGLCGDFNNNDKLEFQGSHNCYYKNATDFSYSYAIPGDGCQVPEIEAPCEPHKP